MCFLEDMEGGEEEEEIRRPEQTKEEEGGVKHRGGWTMRMLWRLLSFFFFPIWPCPTTCRISVPQPGIKPMPHALEIAVSTAGEPGRSLKSYPLLFCCSI